MAKAKKFTDTIEITKSSSAFTLGAKDSIEITSVDPNIETYGIKENAGLQDNVITVLGDITLVGANTNAVAVAGENTTVRIGSGSIVKAEVGVEATSQAINTHIINDGILRGDWGIYANGGTIVNNGSIKSSEVAIFSANDGSNIKNNGALIGYYGAYFGGADSSFINGKEGHISAHEGIKVGDYATDETVKITNKGAIEGSDAAISGSDGVNVSIKNTGKISGDIYLGNGNDIFDTRQGTFQGTIHGGDGNDIYVLKKANTAIVEDTNGGTDVVKIAGNYTLGDNLEQLKLLGKGDFNGTGNALANNLLGNAGKNSLLGMDGSDILNGAAGNDILTGGGGADVFVFAKGNDRDRITDFEDGTETIALQDFANKVNIDFVLDHIAIHGDNAVINFADGDKLTIKGGASMTFDASDFIFIM